MAVASSSLLTCDISPLSEQHHIHVQLRLDASPKGNVDERPKSLNRRQSGVNTNLDSGCIKADVHLNDNFSYWNSLFSCAAAYPLSIGEFVRFFGHVLLQGIDGVVSAKVLRKLSPLIGDLILSVSGLGLHHS